jgi:ArsR family transcriptional regulator
MSQQQSQAARTCCDASEPLSHDLPAETIDSDVARLSALGNETRYELLRLLADADGEVCACDLGPSLPVSQSAVSQALSRLHDAGLVDRRKSGRWRHYEATEAATTLLDALDSVGGDRA